MMLGLMTVFAAQQITYQYQEGKDLFSPLCLTLKSGDGVLLRGANGSGKTTCLQMLAGLRQPVNGQITWNYHLCPNPSFLSEALYIGHKPALHNELNAQEMLSYYAALAGRVDWAAGNALIQEFGLAHHMTQPVRSLSAGQGRKLSLTRLKLIPSRLWFLDEPLSNLDDNSMEVVIELLQQHRAQGGIVIISSHQILEDWQEIHLC